MNRNTLFHTVASGVASGLASALVMDDASAPFNVPVLGDVVGSVPAWAGIALISGAVQLVDDMLVQPNLSMLPNSVQPYLNSADMIGYAVTLGGGVAGVAYASGLELMPAVQVGALAVVSDMASNYIVNRYVKPAGSITI